MTDQDKIMRQQFERECAEWEMDTSRYSDGDYLDQQTSCAWDLWKAATAYANDDRAMRAQPAPAAQGDDLNRGGREQAGRENGPHSGTIQADLHTAAGG